MRVVSAPSAGMEARKRASLPSPFGHGVSIVVRDRHGRSVWLFWGSADGREGVVEQPAYLDGGAGTKR